MPGALDAHIPGETVHPRRGAEGFLAERGHRVQRHIVPRRGLGGILFGLGSIGVQHRALVVENFQREGRRRLRRQAVIDHNRGRRVVGHGVFAARAPRLAIANGGGRGEQSRRLIGAGQRLLAQRCRAFIQHPKAAAHGGQHQIVAMDLDIGDRRHRQIVLQAPPLPAVVEGHKHPVLRSGVQQAGFLRVLAHHADREVAGYAVVIAEQAPAPAVVFRPVNIRFGIAELIAQHADIGHPGHVPRGLHRVHAAAARQAARGDLVPVPAAVAGDIDRTVVGAGPDNPGLQGGLAQGVDRRVDLFTGDVAGNGRAGDHLFVSLKGGQIGGDGLPGDALIAGAMHILRGVVHGVGIVGRHLYRRHALKAIAQLAGVLAVAVGGAHVVAALRARALVEHAEAPLAVDEHGVGSAGFGHGGSGFTAAGFEQQGVGALHAVGQARGDRDGAVIVLLSAVQPVGILVVDFDLIQLGRGLVKLRGPGRPAVVGHVGAAVVGLDKKPGIVGVDPHIVAVGVGRLQLFPGLSAIGGAQVIGRHHVDGVRIMGVRLYIGVVERPRAQALVARDLAETLTLIVRAVQTALLARRFDQGVDDARIGARYGQIDLANQRIGQALADPPPVAPAIAGLVQAAFLGAAAADDGPGLALGLPGRGQHHVGVGRQQFQIGKADLLGHFQHALPTLAAIAAAIHPALGVGVKRLADRRDPHHVVVARIDLHRPDLPDPL